MASSLVSALISSRRFVAKASSESEGTVYSVSLAFLELSDPNVASWGNLIGQGRKVLRSEWYVAAIPGLAILTTILAVSLVGQGLNDALNPRLRKR